MAFTPRQLPQYAALDCLVVAVLTAITLSGLVTSFAGWGWALVGAAGLLIGLGWACLLWVLHLNLSLVVVTLVIPYFLTASAVALQRWGLFLGIPDATSIGVVMQGSYTAWTHLLDTAPSVDSRGVVMLVPFALAMLCGAMGGALAVHTRRPAAPVVALVALMVLVLLLGTPTALARGLPVSVQGLGFGVVALWWIGHRTARDQTDADDDAGRRVSAGRAISAAVCVLVAAAIVVPLTSGSVDRPRWVLRERVTPVDSEPTTTPLSVFRTFRPGHNPEVAKNPLFTVSDVDAGTRLRIAVLDNYDGERWYADRDASPDDYLDRFVRISSSIDNPGRGTEHTVKIGVRQSWQLDWVPVVGRVQGFAYFQDSGSARRDQLRFNRSTNSALTLGYVLKGDEYVLRTKIASERLTPAMNPWPEPNTALQTQAEFLDLPARAWSVGKTRPMDQLFQIASKMRARGRYSDGDPGWEEKFEAGHDADHLLDEFLNGPQMVGNDEQYAATMALLANRIGIPARVVVGAPIGRKGNVYGRDIGAWVEVRIADGSWRTLPTDTFMGNRPPKREAPEQPNIQILPTSQPSPTTQPTETEQPRPEQEQEQQDEPEQAQQEDKRNLAWLLLLVPIAAVGSIPVLKAVRRRRRRNGTPDERALGGWAEVVDTAVDLGLPVAPRSRPEQARALGVDVRLARLADVAAFTDQPPALDVSYEAKVHDARRTLALTRPRWRRAVAAVNPVSLLRRGTR